MRLSCNNFKIRKFVEGNCKILCSCIFFFGCQYMKFPFYLILYSLSFIVTTLGKIPRAVNEGREGEEWG